MAITAIQAIHAPRSTSSTPSCTGRTTESIRYPARYGGNQAHRRDGRGRQEPDHDPPPVPSQVSDQPPQHGALIARHERLRLADRCRHRRRVLAVGVGRLEVPSLQLLFQDEAHVLHAAPLPVRVPDDGQRGLVGLTQQRQRASRQPRVLAHGSHRRATEGLDLPPARATPGDRHVLVPQRQPALGQPHPGIQVGQGIQLNRGGRPRRPRWPHGPPTAYGPAGPCTVRRSLGPSLLVCSSTWFSRLMRQ